MSLIADAIGSAAGLLASADATLTDITLLSLRVSATATLLAPDGQTVLVSFGVQSSGTRLKP